MAPQPNRDRTVVNAKSAFNPALDTPAAPDLFWSPEPGSELFRKVELAKREWETTADSLPQLICLLDEQARLLRVNRTLERWNLGQVTAIHGLDLHSVLHPGCSGIFCYLDRFL